MPPSALLILLLLAAPLVHAQCVFNATHCTCAQAGMPGTCLRFVGPDCLVGTCDANGFTCDCSGSTMCTISTCNAYYPTSNAPLSTLTQGSSVPCSLQPSTSNCVAELLPSPSPTAYRMVQWGAASDANMFNMTAFTDTADNIRTTYAIDNNWPDNDLLRGRYLTVRLYDSADASQRMLCVIIGKTQPTVGFNGQVTIDSTITGVNGQTLAWTACDDNADGECNGTSSTTLTASNLANNNLSDGWCIGPTLDGNSVLVQLTAVNGFNGIVFQSGDGSERTYLFSDGATNGMTGSVSGGLVTGGTIPDITFNMQGLLVP